MKKDFTIITAVYNTAEFIDEAIQSVVSQTVGIDRIQLILVNDASTDNSLAICQKWQQLYPNSIQIINQEQNAGVSAARNAGLQRIEGQWVNFMDSDDKLSPNLCEEAQTFFEKKINERIEVICFPIIYFDGEQGEHPLNDKFIQGTRIVDLDKEWYYSLNFVNSIFVKAEALKGQTFDQRMPLSEDLKFIQEIILRTHCFGVNNQAHYLYRRRTTGQQSAIQSKNSKRTWYVPTLKNGLCELVAAAKEKEGSVPRYLQFLIMYELQWRLKMKDVECTEITQNERQEYYRLISQLLQNVDDEVIMIQNNISNDTKALAKLLKRGWSFDVVKVCRQTRLLKLLKYII